MTIYRLVLFLVAMLSINVLGSFTASALESIHGASGIVMAVICVSAAWASSFLLGVSMRQ